MGIPRYKHVYFNLTLNTFVIFVFSVICFLITYETAKGVFKCIIEGSAITFFDFLKFYAIKVFKFAGHVRPLMLVLLAFR